jgi:hypothetical protein
MSPSEAWRRAARAIHEITGVVDPTELTRRFYREVDRILGPAIGMSRTERWAHHTTMLERELLVESLEERAALINEGKTPTP